MTRSSNLFADNPTHLPDELFTTLLEAANVRIERIVSHGHAVSAGPALRTGKCGSPTARVSMSNRLTHRF